MNSNNAESDKPKRILTRKPILIAIGTLIPLTIALTFISSSMLSQPPSENNLVTFTCSSLQKNATATISVDINLTDGMNQQEALKTALKAFNAEVQMGENYVATDFRTTANAIDEIWIVNLHITYEGGLIGPSKNAYEGGVISRTPTKLIARESYTATINPNTQTVKFERNLNPGD